MAYTDFTANAKLASIYVGYFGRAADPKGFAYWEDDFAARLADGATEEDALIAVAQSFANDTEAKATYSYLDNPDTGDVSEFIDAIYQNLFGHAPDAAGKAYWTEYLETADAGELTVGKFILAVMEGAIGDDIIVLENKAAVSEYYATSYDPEVWENDAAFLAEAKNVISNVTKDPSTVDNAKTDIADIISGEDGGDTSDLTEAMATLDNAKTAKADFLKAGKFANEAAVGTAETTAESGVETALNDAVAGGGLHNDDIKDELAKIDSSYDGKSPAVQSALEEDAMVALNKALAAANSAVTAANVEIGKVNGLGAAINTYGTAVANEEAAGKANTTATTLANAEAAKFNAMSYGKDDSTAFTAQPDGTFKLATGVTEAKYPGVTVLLNAKNAAVAAQDTLDAAEAFTKDAAVKVNERDPGATVDTALKNVGNGFTIESPDDDEAPTKAEMDAEIAALIEAIESVSNFPDGFTIAMKEDGTWDIFDLTGTEVSDPEDFGDDNADADTELTALNTFQGLLDSLQAAYESAPDGELYTALQNAKEDVETVQDFIDDLNDALQDYVDAKADVITLAELNDNIETATDWFTDNGYEAPIDLAKNGFVTATAEDDIFLNSDLEGGDSTNISKFGSEGIDYLFVGEGYKLVGLGDKDISSDKVGNASELEIFFKQSGTTLNLYVETEAFGGNLTNTSEVITISLTGVNAADITLDGSFITAGDLA